MASQEIRTEETTLRKKLTGASKTFLSNNTKVDKMISCRKQAGASKNVLSNKMNAEVLELKCKWPRPEAAIRNKLTSRCRTVAKNFSSHEMNAQRLTSYYYESKINLILRGQ